MSLQPTKDPVRRKTGLKRKSEIINVARELIFNEGFGNFTIRRVAGNIGISEAAIYRHFASKEELLLSLLDYLFSPWRVAIEDLVKSEDKTSQKLTNLAKLHLHHLLQKQLNPILFFSEAIHPDNVKLLKGLQINLQFLSKAITQIIEQGRRCGDIREDTDVMSSVACIVGLMQTSVVKWTLLRSDKGLLDEAQRNITFFLNKISLEGLSHEI